MKTITIIGGGASGTLLAINLIRNSNGTPVTINLVEKKHRLGRGVAFGTHREAHLLNVPAAKMGAFPDDVEHFHRWLVDNGHDYKASSFVPRHLFGQYLRELLHTEVTRLPSNVTFNHIDDEAHDISPSGRSARVSLASGADLSAEHVVLAFGNFSPPHPNVGDRSFAESPRYFRDPWDPSMYEAIRPADSVFIIGTGLSMVDVALHFYKDGRQGKITALSTRGLLPAVHKLGHTYPAMDDDIASAESIRSLLKTVRGHADSADSSGSDWRAVIDNLRPHTQRLWLQLPIKQKRSFMQHLSRYWSAARHRMPGEAAEVLDAMQADGRLQILKGRLKQIEYTGEKKFRIAWHGENKMHTSEYDAVINCIGSESNYKRIESTLVQNLLRNGIIRNDPLSLGLDATPEGSVINEFGRPSVIIHTLGTSLKGILWESTAVPEIRTQAKQLSLRLLSSIS